MVLHWWLREAEIKAPWTYVIGESVILAVIVGWMLLIQAPMVYTLGMIALHGSVGIGDLLSYLLDEAKAARRLRKYVTDDGDHRS
jgi:hypothetical protein